jgi:hypothetical protein
MRAERTVCNVRRQRLKSLPIFRARKTLNEALPNLRKATGADAARNCFSTGFVGTPSRQHGGELRDCHAPVNGEQRT